MNYESICGIPSDKTIEIRKKPDIFYSLIINKFTSVEKLKKNITKKITYTHDYVNILLNNDVIKLFYTDKNFEIFIKVNYKL